MHTVAGRNAGICTKVHVLVEVFILIESFFVVRKAIGFSKPIGTDHLEYDYNMPQCWYSCCGDEKNAPGYISCGVHLVWMRKLPHSPQSPNIFGDKNGESDVPTEPQGGNVFGL